MSDYKTYSDKVFSEALFAAYFRLNDEVAKLHKECAALQAENERLKTERDHYQWASINDGIACNERARENQDLENQIDALKAEVERLRKAGDALSYALQTCKYSAEEIAHYADAWTEAKK